MRPVLLTLIILASTAFSQPKFEVASVKGARGGLTGFTVAGEQVNIGNWSVLQLIARAYGTDLYLVSGPAAIGLRYNIAAKLPAGATEAQIPVMLQALLAERFGLQLHAESKEVTGYNLIVASDGHKMKPAADDDSPPFSMDALNANSRDVPGMSMNSHRDGPTTVTFTKMPMLELARFLDTVYREPVSDRTGLKGNFQGTFDYSSPRSPDSPLPNQITITDAVKPLGLRLERTKVPVTMYVVDKVNTTPTEN